jgi:hypothetical protein
LESSVLFALFFVESAEDWVVASTLPGFYPHSEWASWLRCILGSDFTTQVRHSMTNLDC